MAMPAPLPSAKPRAGAGPVRVPGAVSASASVKGIGGNVSLASPLRSRALKRSVVGRARHSLLAFFERQMNTPWVGGRCAF